jgi:hypothetical protein
MAKKRFVKVAIDQRKLVRDLQKAMGEVVDKTMKFTTQEKYFIGYLMVDEMSQAIEKGLSPIDKQGRFPAYKWAGKKNAKKKENRGLKGTKKFKRELGKSLNQAFANKYPYSVKKKFPQKRERPVNLTLSGDFMSNLGVKVTGRGQFEIGYFERLAALKEQGHREGVNGQPSRPTIPLRGETFSRSVYQRMLQALVDVINMKKVGGSKSSKFSARIGKLFR